MKSLPLADGSRVIVDDRDYDRLKRFSWCVGRRKTNSYARAELRCIDGKRRFFFMHRMILRFPPRGIGVDHVNGNGLDNRRENLRLATQTENLQNRHRTWGSSQYKGVSLRADTGKWQAYITVRGRRRCLGCYSVEEDAARAYDCEARHCFGEFARLNFN